MSNAVEEVKKASNDVTLAIARSIDSGLFLKKLVETQEAAATQPEALFHLGLLRTAIEAHLDWLRKPQKPNEWLCASIGRLEVVK